uniref:Uncharacterized protein n=1 Tax=Oryza punctata TaxID=4537 RepID=A0A0E0LJV1_ORYPU
MILPRPAILPHLHPTLLLRTSRHPTPPPPTARCRPSSVLAFPTSRDAAALAVTLVALATLPSLFRRLQVLVLRLCSRGKEVISSHISTYYSGDDSDSDGTDDKDDASSATSSSGEEEEEEGRRERRIGYYEGAADDDDDDDGFLPWGGTVVWTRQDLPRRISGGARLLAPGTSSAAAIRLWDSITASGGGGGGGGAWWDANEGGRALAAEAPVVLGWRCDHAAVATSTK